MTSLVTPTVPNMTQSKMFKTNDTISSFTCSNRCFGTLILNQSNKYKHEYKSSLLYNALTSFPLPTQPPDVRPAFPKCEEHMPTLAGCSPLLWHICHQRGSEDEIRCSLTQCSSSWERERDDLWLYLCRWHSCGTFSSDTVIVIPQPPFNLQRHSVTADH